MSIDYNDKGKYFTDVIPKAPVPAIIQTSTHRIEGFIHVRADERVKAELDRGELFLAVTDAKVFATDGSVLHQAAFMSIARTQIVWVIPNDTSSAEGEQ